MASVNIKDGLGKIIINYAVIAFVIFLMCLILYVILSQGQKITKKVGVTGTMIINKMVAFFTFCVGIQIIAEGVEKNIPPQPVVNQPENNKRLNIKTMNSSILINNVEIFDGTNEATVRGNVLVKNGLIEKITQESVPVDPGGDTIVLDGKGRFLMPG